jgi:photosystem I P700 chlorophyll a apoprotein A1
VVIGEYSDFLTFKGGLNPVTGGLWLTDIAHHHLALSVLFIFAGHMYRTNWGIGHSMKEILEAHKGPFTGEGHKGLYEILTTSWHAQLAINLAMLGSLSIVVAHHMYDASLSIYSNRLCDTTFIIHTPYVDWWILCSWWCCSCCYFHGS